MGESKLQRYEGFLGRVHEWRDKFKESISALTADHSNNFFYKDIENVDQKFSHLFRRKTRFELMRICAVIAGIELSYAAETAFVSPILLQIGIKHKYISLIWAISPIIGFFLCPILGSLSDGCQLSLGRRRPFILLLSSGLFVGLLLVPNGKYLGSYFGDKPFKENSSTLYDTEYLLSDKLNIGTKELSVSTKSSHYWGIIFTVLGTVFLDSMADSCQSPARSYLVDICHPEDHARGLSTFTIMAGLGGSLGYTIGAIDWSSSLSNNSFSAHVQTVFAMITVAFIASVTLTMTSFSEVPLNHLKLLQSDEYVLEENSEIPTNTFHQFLQCENNIEEHSLDESQPSLKNETKSYSINSIPIISQNTQLENPVINLQDYLKSIIYMPRSIQIICLTNLFCWMAHVCYSLYFTDFVGEVIFEGNPTAKNGTLQQYLYYKGVRFGCWGMALYSLSCALYSLIIEKLLKQHGAKRVYIGGLLTYSTGMFVMVVTRSKIAVIFLSGAAGIMYATVFTMPYVLVVHYHVQGVFQMENKPLHKLDTKQRGLGTDIAIVNSMIFLAQFLLSVILSLVTTFSGSISIVIFLASFFSLCAAITASHIMYLKL